MKKCDWCNKREAPLEYSGSRQHKYQVREGTFKFKGFCSEKCKGEYLDSKGDSNSNSSESDSYSSKSDSSYLDDQYDRIEEQRNRVSEENDRRRRQQLEESSKMNAAIRQAQKESDEIEAEIERAEKILKRKEDLAKAEKRAQDKENERIREQEREIERELERVRQKKIFKEKNEIYSKKVEAIEYILPEEIKDCIEVLAQERKKLEKYEPLNLETSKAAEKKAWLKMDANIEMLKDLTHLLNKVADKNTKLL